MAFTRDPRSARRYGSPPSNHPTDHRPDPDPDGPATRERSAHEASTGSAITRAETIGFVVALIAVVVLVALI